LPGAATSLSRAWRPAGHEDEKKTMRISARNLFVGSAVALGLAYFTATFSTGSPSKPSCASDWKLCADNADLMQNYSNMIRVRSRCRTEANTHAKFGDPKWSSGVFGRYRKGSDYISTGRVTMGEDDVQFQNAFGAWQHMKAICIYDLNSDKVDSVELLER
jgi:hypothetical protein